MIGDFPDLVSNHTGLAFSAATCSIAAAYSLFGAIRGVIFHRLPRMLLAVSVAVVAVSYWADVFHWWEGAQMRRGAGWLLWPSLAWTAWSGIAYGRRVKANVEATREWLDREENER